MTIAILGATGGTGKSLTAQALAAGHAVVASSRHPENVGIDHPDLTKRPSNIFDVASIRAVIRGADAVVFSVGSSSILDARNPGGVYAEGARNTIAAAEAEGIDRVLFVSSSGIEDKPGDPWWYTGIVKPVFMKGMYAEMAEMERLIRASDLDYTIVRAPWLSDGELTRDFEVRVTDEFLPDDRLSRADLAYYLLGEVEGGEHRGEVVSLTY